MQDFKNLDVKSAATDFPSHGSPSQLKADS